MDSKKFENNDFLYVDFDLYANGDLIQTTNEELGKKENLPLTEYKPIVMILGKNFLLKSLDDYILKEQKDEGTLDLEPKDAYGEKDKSLIRVYPISVFQEHKLTPQVGMVYNFNGMYGTVKNINGNRVTIDFNHLLAGKNIKINYKIIKVIKELDKKIKSILSTFHKISENEIKVNLDKDKKEIIIKLNKDLLKNQPDYYKSILNILGEELKGYENNIRFEKLN